jgi:hypothetical protein
LPAETEVSVATLLLDERERIVIIGPLARALMGQSVVRLRSDGTRDMSFRMNESNLSFEPAQLLLTPQRKILAAGSYFGVFRINGDPYPELTLERRFDAAGWRLISSAIPHSYYRLQASTDLRVWETLEWRISEECSMEFLLPDGAPRRFYRVEQVTGP